MAGFTPGPWAVSKNSSGRRVTSVTGIVICNAVLRNTGRADRGISFGSKEHKQAVANARLIAAAPDLLSCLIDVLDYVEATDRTGFYDEGGSAEYAAQIRAAIRRATNPEEQG